MVYGIAAVGGCAIFIARGVRDGGAFFYVLAALNAVCWIGLLMLVLVVDNRRRRLARLDEGQERRPSSREQRSELTGTFGRIGVVRQQFAAFATELIRRP
ncbi:hypothetical protein FHR75_003944 [Kineococcus radiotolerans]|uniref:Uncharacterized protein n=1 Tax=Kineococcus radiotolerans TaxID=131568 RepID=A0A7W4TR34_KINRA|nr:hypothetical protein [Kineococcus radiotolerans]MBB2903102.1 hypothetical protein [Kineococcus radiotolerans]